MNLQQLKDIINNVSDEYLDLEVRVIADHGQCAMLANTASLDYIAEDNYMADCIHEDDLTEDSVMIFLIGD